MPTPPAAADARAFRSRYGLPFLLVTLLIAASHVALVWSNHRAAAQALSQELERQGERFRESYRLNLDQTATFMQQAATYVANDPRVQELFLRGRRAVEAEGGGAGGERAARLRAELLELVRPSWEAMTRDYGIRQLHFHLAPGDYSFLRVHKPGKFGDDLSPVRHSIVAANTRLVPTKGFESGRVYAGVRGVVPVFAADPQGGERVHVGALEAGTSFTLMLEQLRGHLRAHFAVLMTLEHARETMWPEFLKKYRKTHPVFEGHLLESTTGAGAEGLLERPEVRALLQRPGTVLTRDGDGPVAVTAIPLRDFRGMEEPGRPAIGTVLVWADAGAEAAALERSLWSAISWAAAGFVGIELLLALVWGFGIRRFERAVAEKTAQLAESNRALGVAVTEARQAARVKATFVANMSHEIRTPMNGVVGMLQLLERTELKRDQRHYVDTAIKSATLQLDLINNILDFSKIEAGSLTLERIEFNLHRVVTEVADMLAESASGKGVELALYLAEETPHWLKGDPTRLRQILLNLTGNAIKFTDHGEVVVRVEPRGERVRFEVADTGIGIPAELHEQIFQPFTQADDSTTRRFGGTGLGLMICKELVEAMGGEIGLDSRPGEGTRFWFLLPLERIAREADPAPADLARLRLLVVDDNDTNRSILEQYLSGWGVAFSSVAGAAEALATARRAAAVGEPFDLLLSDMHMPEMDGLGLAEAIRDSEITPKPLILLLTSGAQPDDDALAAAGIGVAVAKPITPSRLLDSLATLLDGQEVQAGVAGPPPARFRGRVLLAEDNFVNQQVAQGMLTQLGLEVVVVGDGAEAVARSAAEPFDLVLMDVQMPVMDGTEATRRIRRRERETGGARLPIAALTAHALSGDREAMLAAGMDDYLSKPLQFGPLMELLGRWLAAAEEEEVEENSLDAAAVENLCTGLAAVPGGVAQVVTAYLEEAPGLLEEIAAGLAAADLEVVLRAAHSLKSQSAAVGAARLSSRCAEIEGLARGGTLEGVAELLAAGRESLARVLPALERLRDE